MQPRHVYVHVPFCARRCSYCDFAIAVRARVPTDEYVRALDRELEVRALGDGAGGVDTIYLGGGTPSRLGADGVARVLETVFRRFPPAPDAEITIEANPEDLTRSDVEAWRRSGVNRVSVGVQSFDDRALAWMHRTHDAARVVDAARALAEAGMSNWSLDLIFALSASLERDWMRDVDRALALDPPHVSLYGLTVEPHTPLARWRDRGQQVDASEDTYEREYLHAHQALSSAGYDHYEVSNFGRPGRWSRHNRSYWRGASYVGLGPAAHGFDGHTRRWNEREYASWVRRLDAGADPIGGSERLTTENRVAEEVYLGLRTTDGLELQAVDLPTVERWFTAGWATAEDGILRLSPTGWLRLDALAASLTASRSR